MRKSDEMVNCMRHRQRPGFPRVLNNGLEFHDTNYLQKTIAQGLQDHSFVLVHIAPGTPKRCSLPEREEKRAGNANGPEKGGRGSWGGMSGMGMFLGGESKTKN